MATGVVTVIMVLAVCAFICALMHLTRPNNVPLWIAVLLLTIIELIRAIPLGK